MSDDTETHTFCSICGIDGEGAPCSACATEGPRMVAFDDSSIGPGGFSGTRQGILGCVAAFRAAAAAEIKP